LSTVATDPHAGCLSASWLSARLAVDTARIDAMRRSGELIAVRPEGSTTWLYPSWQFEGGRPRPVVARIAAAAREAGLDERALYELLHRPLGIVARGGERRCLADLVAAGEDDQVVAAVRAARPA
jgi:hypothetical protein